MKAKLIDGNLKYATNYEIINGSTVINPSDEQLLDGGFKDVISQQVDILETKYSETETTIIEYFQKPDYVETPIEEPIEQPTV